MTEPGGLITDALRQIADQATAPPPMAGAAWRAGRRRRIGGTAASVAVLAGAIAIVVSVTTAGQGSAPPRPATRPGPVTLSQVIQLRQVARISPGLCPAHSSGLSLLNPASCVHLARTGMTITQGRAGWLSRGSVSGDYAVTIQLTHADRGRFAALTRTLFRLPSPHNQVAVIIGGHLTTMPVIEGPITGGFIQIAGLATVAQADRLIAGLPHPSAGPAPRATAPAR